LKAQERHATGKPQGTLSGLPGSLPALLRAFKIGKRAASVGFDWAQAADVVAKIDEEVAELREAVERHPRDKAKAEEEMGDLLFALANLCRKLGLEPEAALRAANEKFTARFTEMERRFAERGRRLSLIRFGGHFPKGGYDVQNGITQGRPATAATVHGRVHGRRGPARVG